MNRKKLVSALSVAIFIGIMVLPVVSLYISGNIAGINRQDQAAPAMRTNPAPVLAVSAHFEQIEAVLNQSATGRQFLNLKEAYRVSVQFEAGYGSRYRQNTNLILLDSNLDPVKAALFFAHEMHHARTLHEGNKADFKSEARQAYVNFKLQEEAEGMMASIQVKMELEKIGLHVANITLPLENQYRQAYQVASDQTKLSDATLNENQLDNIGRSAGLQALYEAFASGDVKTSNTYDSYPDYYGRDWDRAHPVKAFIADIFGA